MSVWVTGDIHGNPVRLSTENFYEQKEFSGNKNENTVIILGDFGLIWNRNGEDKQEKYWLNWLENKPFTTGTTNALKDSTVTLSQNGTVVKFM